MVMPVDEKRWIRLVLCRMADKFFALTTDRVAQIIYMARLMEPPGLPSFCPGFLNLRGKAVPVVNLAVLMQFPDVPVDLYTPLVIVKTDKIPLALLVEKVVDVITVNMEQICPLENHGVFNQCVSGTGKNNDGNTFHLLSPEQILLAREKQRMVEFKDILQTRLDDPGLKGNINEKPGRL